MQRAPEGHDGRKKGAHYSAHMRRFRILGLLALLPCALAIAGRHTTHAHSPTDARRARAQREADLTANRGALAGQLRAAYLIGGQEPLKLLLNQGDPVRAGRMFAYYSYFGRARALKIQGIEADLQRI